MPYLTNLCRSIDQLCNTIIGGNTDVTISGHVGYKANENIRWQWLSDLIDFTFKPIEENHCYESFLNDADIDATDNLFTTSVVAVIGCIILWIPIRLLGYVTDKR